MKKKDKVLKQDTAASLSSISFQTGIWLPYVLKQRNTVATKSRNVQQVRRHRFTAHSSGSTDHYIVHSFFFAHTHTHTNSYLFAE